MLCPKRMLPTVSFKNGPVGRSFSTNYIDARFFTLNSDRHKHAVLIAHWAKMDDIKKMQYKNAHARLCQDALTGQVRAAKELLKKLDPLSAAVVLDQTDANGVNLLFKVLSKPDNQMAMLLLVAGASAAVKDRFESTVLMACIRRLCPCVALTLLEKGVDPCAKDAINGWTALHYLAAPDHYWPFEDKKLYEEGHCEIAQYLLEQGACPKDKDFDGVTPLQMALENGHHSLLAAFQGKTANKF